MKCDVCEKDARDVTVISISRSGGVRRNCIAVCEPCRERILRDSKLHSLAAIAHSLTLGSFQDTVA